MPRAAKTSPAPAGGASSPLINAALVTLALAGGLGLLVARGRLAWPPRELIQGAYTLAGCLALIGPVILLRRESAGGGLGDLLWLTAGSLFWIYNAFALLAGAFRTHSWTTPLGPGPLGLTLLAVLVAGWRLRGPGGRDWSWTNVTGWLLGLFWVGLGLAASLPIPGLAVAVR